MRLEHRNLLFFNLALTIYIYVSQRCEQLATSVLDHCGSLRDVRVILDYSPRDILEDNTNWYLALLAHQKSFVGHHYYQHFLREKVDYKITM